MCGGCLAHQEFREVLHNAVMAIKESKMSKKDLISKIRYRRYIGSQVPSHRIAILFHRTDYHEDGSKSEYYGIEMSKSQWKKVKDNLILV